MKKILLLIGWMSCLQGVSALERDEGSSKRALPNAAIQEKEKRAKTLRQLWLESSCDVALPVVKKVLEKKEKEVQAIKDLLKKSTLTEKIFNIFSPIDEHIKTMKSKVFHFSTELFPDLACLQGQSSEVLSAFEEERRFWLERTKAQDFGEMTSPLEESGEIESINKLITDLESIEDSLFNGLKDLSADLNDVWSAIEEGDPRLWEASKEKREAILNEEDAKVREEAAILKEKQSFQRERISSLKKYDAIEKVNENMQKEKHLENLIRIEKISNGRNEAGKVNEIEKLHLKINEVSREKEIAIKEKERASREEDEASKEHKAAEEGKKAAILERKLATEKRIRTSMEFFDSFPFVTELGW